MTDVTPSIASCTVTPLGKVLAPEIEQAPFPTSLEEGTQVVSYCGVRLVGTNFLNPSNLLRISNLYQVFKVYAARSDLSFKLLGDAMISQLYTPDGEVEAYLLIQHASFTWKETGVALTMDEKNKTWEEAKVTLGITEL